MTTQNTTTTEKAVAPKQEKQNIRALLTGDKFKTEVANALPKHLKPERFIRIALTAMTRTPKLAECDPHSFFMALLSLSQFGLEPDGRRAHLIPFKNNKKQITECQLIVDYKGLVELAMRSGALSNIHADVVCENDEFEYDAGEVKRHRINFKKERGEVYAVYCIARFKDGGTKADCMSIFDINRIRDRSRSKDDGPWVTDWDEMAKKTVFRRLSKWLPLSPEYRDAIDYEDEQENQEDRFAAAKPIFAADPLTLPEPTRSDVPEFAPEPETVGAK